MTKDYHKFHIDVEKILHNEESEWKEVQKEWQETPADNHLQRYAQHDAEKGFAKFLHKTSEHDDTQYSNTAASEETTRSARRFYRLWKPITTIAASIIIIIGVALTWQQYANQEPSRIEMIASLPSANDSVPRIRLADGSIVNVVNQVTAGTVSASLQGNSIILKQTDDDEDIITMEEIIIPRGKMYKLELFDGSKILLNSESSLRFPSRFADARNVELKGQAFFEVAKDGRPFTIKTRQGTITVLGTSFSVNSYQDQTFKIVLSTGRIQFQNKHTNTTITAGQVITCDEEGHTTVTSMTPQHNLSWTEGIISFDDQSLENIMNHIERMYDVTVHYSDDNIKQLRFTGECSRFQSVEDFLTVLSTTEDFHFHMEERDIYIYPATQGNEIQE